MAVNPLVGQPNPLLGALPWNPYPIQGSPYANIIPQSGLEDPGLELSEKTKCYQNGGWWDNETQTCVLSGFGGGGGGGGGWRPPSSSTSGSSEFDLGTVKTVDGFDLPVIIPGDPRFSDKAGTGVKVSDLPRGASAAEISKLEGGTREDNYQGIPAPGEVFVVNQTGIDSNGNKFNLPTVVADSSSPGGLHTPTAINIGTHSPYSHLTGNIKDAGAGAGKKSGLEGIIDSAFGGKEGEGGVSGILDSILGQTGIGQILSVVESVTGSNPLSGITGGASAGRPGLENARLNSTNQLAQGDSVSIAGKWVPDGSGGFKYSTDPNDKGTPNPTVSSSSGSSSSSSTSNSRDGSGGTPVGTTGGPSPHDGGGGSPSGSNTSNQRDGSGGTPVGTAGGPGPHSGASGGYVPNSLIAYRQSGGPLPPAGPPMPPQGMPPQGMPPAGPPMPPQGMPPAPMPPLPPAPQPMTFAEKVEEARKVIKSGRASVPSAPELSTPPGLMMVDAQGDGPVEIMPGAGSVAPGMVGPDQGVDTIDTELEEGSFVLNPEASEMYGDEVRAMVSGGPVYRQGGGIVGMANSASQALGQASEAIQSASGAIGGGSGGLSGAPGAGLGGGWASPRPYQPVSIGRPSGGFNTGLIAGLLGGSR